MTKNFALAPIMLAILLPLAACSGTPAQEAAGEPSAPAESVPAPPPLPSWKASDGPVTFTCEHPRSGAIYEFSLPTDESHEAIKKVEVLRKEAKLPGKVSYLLVKIDATKGVDQNSGALYKVSWATADQESRQTKSIDTALSEWREAAVPDTSKPGSSALYNKFITLGNELMKTGPNRGGKGYELQVLESMDTTIDSMIAPYASSSAFESSPCAAKS